MTTPPTAHRDGCARTPCRSYRPGHAMHHLHASQAGRSPWGWRDATVVRFDGRAVTVAYLDGDTNVTLWHHEPLEATLREGEPVRLHEQHHALGHPGGWLSVEIVAGGLGPVPKPVEAALWADEVAHGVVDLATGHGVAIDHRRE